MKVRDHARWAFDLDRGEVRFEFADGRTATAAMQVVGTINTRNGSWLWAWANSSIPESLRQDALRVRSFGAHERYALLSTRSFPCDESLAWRLTTLAAKLGDARGVYRAPVGPALLFLTFGPWKLTGGNPQSNPGQERS